MAYIIRLHRVLSFVRSSTAFTRSITDLLSNDIRFKRRLQSEEDALTNPFLRGYCLLSRCKLALLCWVYNTAWKVFCFRFSFRWLRNSSLTLSRDRTSQIDSNSNLKSWLIVRLVYYLLSLPFFSFDIIAIR